MKTKSKKKMIKLDEGFAVMMRNSQNDNAFLLFTVGKQLTKDFALTLNSKSGTVGLTHIKSGKRVNDTFYKLSKNNRVFLEIEELKNQIKKAENDLSKYSKLVQKGIKEFDYLMKEKRFE